MNCSKLAAFLYCIALMLLVYEVEALNNGVAMTPPMGWMSWVRFGCNMRCDIDIDNCISERLYMQMADIMYTDGYRDAGYQYVAIDDCWMAQTRDSNNKLQSDTTRFPHGIKYLADYLHSRGLKLGLYADIGTSTCAGFPGSKGFLQLDAMTFAEWGVDMIKIDGCNANLVDYSEGYPAMGVYLNKTGRPILYSCQWPMYARYYGGVVNYTEIAATCNMFRALTDIYLTFRSVTSMFDYYQTNPYNFTSVAGPGAWNDPDQLVIGGGGMSNDQERVTMAMWSLLAAPLIMSNDLRHMRRSSKAILLNRNVIAINQDPLGKQGQFIMQHGDVTVWTKPVLPLGSLAVVFINRALSGGPKLVVFNLEDVHIGCCKTYDVTELFDNIYIGRFRPTQNIRFKINPSGVYFIKATINNNIQ